MQYPNTVVRNIALPLWSLWFFSFAYFLVLHWHPWYMATRAFHGSLNVVATNGVLEPPIVLVDSFTCPLTWSPTHVNPDKSEKEACHGVGGGDAWQGGGGQRAFCCKEMQSLAEATFTMILFLISWPPVSVSLDLCQLEYGDP